MELRFQMGGPEQWTADAMVLLLAEGESLAAAPGFSTIINGIPWLEIAPGSRDFRGRQGEVAVVYGPKAHPVSRIVLAGLGKLEELSSDQILSRIREAVGKSARRCRALELQTFGIPVATLSRFFSDAGEDTGRAVEEAVCAAFLSLWRNKNFKSEAPRPDDPRWLAIFTDGEFVPDAVRQAGRLGEICASAVMMARDLANTPSNALFPEDMAEAARQLARRYGMRCEVLGRRQIVDLGMGALASVSAGSLHEPRLVILEHVPAGHEEEAPLVVVGKGITFDSGGISLKPAAGMWEMKGDMGGAASVLGLFEALGQLNLPRHVVGLMACAENMPDAGATRPGDVVKTLAGKTVEIVNTDAEGRLVLCDALAYAQQQWKPALLVDVATLTGACVVALGDDVAGIFATERSLAEKIVDLGATVGEPYWPLPLDDRYFENLKSETADFANSGARAGGACTAAIFLKQFIEKGMKWVHLDVAGPAFVTRKIVNCPAGATGFPVRTLIELALSE